MSVLKDSRLTNYELEAFEFYEVDGFGLDDVQRFVGRVFWRWFRENQNLIVVSVGKWFIRFNVRVRDLRPLFQVLFGDEPSV